MPNVFSGTVHPAAMFPPSRMSTLLRMVADSPISVPAPAMTLLPISTFGPTSVSLPRRTWCPIFTCSPICTFLPRQTCSPITRSSGIVTVGWTVHVLEMTIWLPSGFVCHFSSRPRSRSVICGGIVPSSNRIASTGKL